MALKEYILKRLVYSVILIFAALTVNFLIFAMMPGDPLRQYMARVEIHTNEEQYEMMREQLGLNKPLHLRYTDYLVRMLTWNFGNGMIGGGAPVAEQIMNRLPNTLILMGSAAVLSMIAGIFIGVLVAYKRGGLFDTLTVTGSLITYSVPIFFIGWLMIFFLGVQLHWFPLGSIAPRTWGRTPPANAIEFLIGRISHLVLPTITLFLFSVGGWILLSRACVLETITEDYVITARAKGLKERTVLYKHVLKNASLPLITSVAISFGFLISGAIITETLFDYNGMGLLIWDAIRGGAAPDLPVLQAIFYIIALAVIVANFIADLLYGVIDPRIKYG
jgi:peptide/nickel transport system permease protein